MRRTLGVVVVLLLLLGLAPKASYAQASSGGKRGLEVKGNYPNPFNPDTRISFNLSEELFQNGGPVVLTIRIYNVLQQLVAVPTAMNHPAGNNVRVENLMYNEPGDKLAYWDGNDRTGRKAASGVYYMQFIVNGQKLPVRKLVMTK